MDDERRLGASAVGDRVAAGESPAYKDRHGLDSSEGFDSTMIDEDTPLLARDETISIASSHGSDEPAPGGATSSSSNYFSALPWWKRPSIFWLLPSLLAHTLAFGGILVPKLTLILQLICKDYLAAQAPVGDSVFGIGALLLQNETDAQCRDAKVQELVSKFNIGLQLASAIPSILMAPKLGALSDRYGRVRVLAFTGVGVLVSEVVTILAAKYPETVSVYWMILGSVLDGACGTFIAAMAITSAYAADCYPASRRAVVFGWVHGCLFAGIALGPFAAALIIRLSGTILAVFYIALGVHALFLPYILFIVPESVTKERQLAARQRSEAVGHVVHHPHAPEQKAWWSRALSLLARGGGLFTPLTILWPTGPGTSRALRLNLVLLAAVDFVVFGVAMGSVTVVVYYLGYMFNWDAAASSLFIAGISTCRVLILLVVLPLVTRLVQGKYAAGAANKAPKQGSSRLDIALIRVAICFDTIGFLGYAASWTGQMFLASGCVAAIGAMASPTLQSSLTKHVPPDRVGQLLGAIGLLHGLARVAAPIVFNLIYAETVEFFPQTVFFCLAAMFGVGVLLSIFIKPHVYLNDEDQGAPQQDVVDPLRENLIDEEVVL